jgi:uncharacterized alpha-E superfamily protein
MPSRRCVDDTLIAALACGATAEQAARKVDVAVRTVFRRLADPDFKDQVKAAQAELLKRTCGALTAGSLAAVQTLMELQKPGATPAVRLGAARAVLELALKVRDASDFEEWLALLEHQAAASQPHRWFR